MFEIQVLDKNLNVIDRESNPKNFVVSTLNQKVNAISESRVSIYYESSLASREVIKKWRKINIFLGWKLIFAWVIKWFTAWIEKIDLIINDYFYLLSRRLLRIDKTYTDTSIKDILTDLLTYINWIDETNIVLNCDISDLLTQTFTRWTSFYQILQDISKNWFSYKLENNILYFSNVLWEDKSADIYYIYNKNEPYWQNIDKIELIEDMKDFSNWIIDKSWDYSDNDSVNDIWLYETKESDDIDRISYINEHLIIWDYKITPRVNSYFEANLWDSVWVDILSNNDILFFSWKMEIIEKTFQNWDLQKINFTLSTSKIKIKDFMDDYLALKNKVLILENK